MVGLMNEITKDTLRSRGFRVTPQRLAVIDVLRQADRHLLPKEIFIRTKHRIPGVNEATVYRALNFLTEQGFILAAHVGGGKLMYEIAGHDHHHLICRNCHCSIQIGHKFLLELYSRLEENTGFQINSVHTTFFGLCPECLKKD